MHKGLVLFRIEIRFLFKYMFWIYFFFKWFSDMNDIFNNIELNTLPLVLRNTKSHKAQ